MAISKEDILEAVGSLTVMELNDLVKAFEEKFGVSAAAVAVAGPAGAGAAAAAPATGYPETITVTRHYLQYHVRTYFLYTTGILNLCYFSVGAIHWITEPGRLILLRIA